MASAPLVEGTLARHSAATPPPSSSVKMTLVPALLNVAECQNAKLTVSRTRVITLGDSGRLMSSRMPSPMHAPAAMSFFGYAVMSWQPLVSVLGVLGGLPVSPGKWLGVATTAAAAGSRTAAL